MLRKLRGIFGYHMQTRDETIGRLDDILFDDVGWQVRYLVLDTGEWLPGRRVLISPVEAGELKPQDRAISIDRTPEEIEQSPELREDAPVSRQYEQSLAEYWDWQPYWGPMGVAGAGAAALAAQARATEREEEDVTLPEDPHLRSVEEVVGYSIDATDGQIGQVDDFILETDNWVIRYTVIDTGGWLAGREVLVAPAWIDSIDWAARQVEVDLDRETIENSPEYRPDEPITRDYEKRLYEHYQRRTYWE